MPVFPGYPTSIIATEFSACYPVLAQGGHQANPAEGLLVDGSGRHPRKAVKHKRWIMF
jgi:hypothetical protein